MQRVVVVLLGSMMQLSGAEGDTPQKFLTKYTFPASSSLKTHLQAQRIALGKSGVDSSLEDIADHFGSKTYTEIQLPNVLRDFCGKNDIVEVQGLLDVLRSCPGVQRSDCVVNVNNFVEHARGSCWWQLIFFCCIRPHQAM